MSKWLRSLIIKSFAAFVSKEAKRIRVVKYSANTTAKLVSLKIRRGLSFMAYIKTKLPIRISNKESKKVIIFKKRIAETFGHTLFVEHRKKWIRFLKYYYLF